MQKQTRSRAADQLKMDVENVQTLSLAARDKASMYGKGMLEEGTPLEAIERELTRYLSMENVPREDTKSVVASSISSYKLPLALVESQLDKDFYKLYGLMGEKRGIEQHTKETGREVEVGLGYLELRAPGWHPNNCKVKTFFGGVPDGIATAVGGDLGKGRKILVEIMSRMGTMKEEIPLHEKVSHFLCICAASMRMLK